MEISVVMAATNSKFETATTFATEFSDDGVTWKPIPLEVKVTCSRYALVMRDLRLSELELDLGSYVVGSGPSEGKRFSDYIRGRVDKGCAIYRASTLPDKRILVAFTAVLVSPYAVFVR